MGHIFVGDRYWIAKPLTLISTWDGDEISMIRTHEALRAAWKIDFAESSVALAELASTIAEGLGGSSSGVGLAQMIRCDWAKADAFAHAAEAQGLVVGRGAPGVLRLLPALDLEAEIIRGEIADSAKAALEDLSKGSAEDV